MGVEGDGEDDNERTTAINRSWAAVDCDLYRSIDDRLSGSCPTCVSYQD